MAERWVPSQALCRLAWLLVLAAIPPLVACSHVDYYSQSVGGHLWLMAAAQPVDQLLADPQTPPPLRERLLLTQRVRDFASRELHLPDNPSYRRYADLKRPAAVWNVVASSALSLRPTQWCFPVAGCVSYRGYFEEAQAREFAAALRQQGLDASVFAVPAYSTLGWLNWMGGDPLLNTFLHYPEGELARLVFHELAHQVVYVSDDSAFNESFATFVEREGGRRWLAQAGERARRDFEALDARRRGFRALLRETRAQLLHLYGERDHADDDGAEATRPRPEPRAEDRAKLQAKQRILSDFRLAYAALRQQWGGHAGYDAWVEQAGNPLFITDHLYESLVPAFEALFEREGRDWQRFYDAVRETALLPRNERRQRLWGLTR